MVQLLHLYMITGKTTALTIWTFVNKVMPLLFNTLSWRKEWQLTPVFLPGEFHGQRRLAGYSPWGRKELDMTEQLTHTQVCHSFSSKEEECLNFVATVTIQSDSGAQEYKICHCFHFSPIYLPWNDGTRCHDLSFWILSFKPVFSLSFFYSSFLVKLSRNMQLPHPPSTKALPCSLPLVHRKKLKFPKPSRVIKEQLS